MISFVSSKWFALAVLVAGIVALVVYLRRRKTPIEQRIDRALTAAGSGGYTPREVRVVQEAGTSLLTIEQLDAIDRGLQDVFDRAAVLGYRRCLEPSLYTIVILRGEAYKGVRVFRLSTGLAVAGICVDLDNRVVAVADHDPVQLDELARIVGYEAEHIVLYFNDPELFERTETHAPGEGHPLF